MLKKYISKEEAKNILENEITSQIFSVTFIKRSNGQLRKMVARKGVKKHLKGGRQNYKPKDYNLLGVYSLDSKGYRSVDLNSVQEIKVKGITYQVKEEE